MSSVNKDKKLPLDEIGPAETYNAARDDEAISPADPGTMPRAEDDEETYARSPEFRDRPAAGSGEE
jgi:hypothetical protein